MKLKEEIKQRKPFPTVQEEAILALMRTADRLAGSSNTALRAANLSSSQYNVLRILRGAGAEGLACGEISERMIRRDPDLTRLLDRLEKAGLVSRARGTTDRRVVRASITESGLALLASLDEPIQAATRETLAHVSEERLQTLLEILEEIRG
ncbi:MAG TPA: MarR family transcriptional regulator [Thermoanaerobaculia bacterium]|nr:MarR family transcriptional regulator [Thermoanaerobaculia bacterium]